MSMKAKQPKTDDTIMKIWTDSLTEANKGDAIVKQACKDMTMKYYYPSEVGNMPKETRMNIARLIWKQ